MIRDRSGQSPTARLALRRPASARQRWGATGREATEARPRLHGVRDAHPGNGVRPRALLETQADEPPRRLSLVHALAFDAQRAGRTASSPSSIARTSSTRRSRTTSGETGAPARVSCSTRACPRRPTRPTRARGSPPFFRVDLRLEKRWQLGQKTWISFVAEWMNATLSKEAVGTMCTLNDGCQTQTVGPVSIPSLGVEGGF